MHYSTYIREIKPEIEKFGHTIVNIFNIKQNRANIPLSLFFVNLKASENNKDIYQIENLNYTKVKFEPPKPKRNIPQCSKCQRCRHTQAYCYHSPRCVKCAFSRLTKQCSRKEKSESVKCVLCDGTHPANYNGCTVYRSEPSRHYEPKKKEGTRKTSCKHIPNQTSLTLLLSNLNATNSRLLARTPNNKQHTSSSYNCHQVTHKN